MERNAFFDNARVILIFFVVFGHMIQPYTSDANGINSLYTWIYIFHMPAFIFISGFFAKGLGTKEYIWNLFKKILVPYFIFQMIYTAYYFLIGKSGWLSGLFHPQWSLWFLMSLFFWHILLYFYKKLKPGYAVSLAVLIGILVGYITPIGHMFSLSRTLVFFPFFLLGYLVTEKQLMLVKKTTVMRIGLLVLALIAIAVHMLPGISTGWLLHSSSYADLGASTYGGLIRLAVYLLAAIMVVSVLAWIPKNHIVGFTSIGANTLTVYLLHGFFIQYFREASIFTVTNFMDVIGLAAISAGLVYLLATKFVVGITQPLIEGKATWIKEKLEQKKTQTDN
ncbi:acyltransferase family protein [Oceanobacillus sp. CAU 1775]